MDIEAKCHVMLYEYLPPTDGGIAQAAFETAKEFQQRGLKTTLCGFNDLFSDPIYNSIKMDLFGLPRKGWKHFKDLYLLILVFRLYLRYGRNVILYSQTWKTARTTFFFAKILGWTSVVFAHGNEVTRQLGGRKATMMKSTFEKADFIFANSNYTASRLQEIAINAIVNKLGVDVNHFTIENELINKKRFGWNGKKVLLTAARVVSRKGQDFVIESLREIRKSVPNILYVIAGGGDVKEIDRLRRISIENGVDDIVVFTGYVDEKTKLSLYNACDLYTMISRSLNDNKDIEGFGITFLEANCCGKPVIGSNSGGIPDAIESGVNGYVVAPNDKESFVKCVCDLLLDGNKCQKMGQIARERVEKYFTWEKYVDRMFSSMCKS